MSEIPDEIKKRIQIQCSGIRTSGWFITLIYLLDQALPILHYSFSFQSSSMARTEAMIIFPRPTSFPKKGNPTRKKSSSTWSWAGGIQRRLSMGEKEINPTSVY